MSSYGPALNGITVGAMLNCMLYMLEIIQLVRYCRSYWKRDKWHLKLVVILCFIIDTICTIAICAWVFMSTVTHWGEASYLVKQYWPTPTYVFCTVVVGALVQTFLIHRYYTLSKQRIVAALLFLCMLSALGGGMSVGFILIFFSTYADRNKAIVSTTVWLVSSSAADVSIAIALVTTFISASSRTQTPTTKSILYRLTRYAVQSGTVTTVLAILVLSIYLAKPETNDSAYFSFCLGRTYTLTMLFNLNLRKVLEDALTGATSKGNSGVKRKSSASQPKSLGSRQLSSERKSQVDGTNVTDTTGMVRSSVGVSSQASSSRMVRVDEKPMDGVFTFSEIKELNTLPPESPEVQDFYLAAAARGSSEAHLAV